MKSLQKYKEAVKTQTNAEKIMKYEDYIRKVREDKEKELREIRKHYEAGKRDCAHGVYDKWYRYNAPDDGFAYNLGWQEKNERVQNETVRFIENVSLFS